MKRCPECRRDYANDTLLYCLEDGVALVQGSVPSPAGPETAILDDTAPTGEVEATVRQLKANLRMVKLTGAMGLSYTPASVSTRRS